MQVYICGESDSVSLPDDPLSIKPRASAMKSLQASPHPLLWILPVSPNGKMP